MFTDTMDNADPFLARMEEVALRYKGRYDYSASSDYPIAGALQFADRTIWPFFARNKCFA
jgi:hypothetical protein